jgi:CelD/BcsL family acetyltransferase involved in cellulose biosynthesis
VQSMISVQVSEGVEAIQKVADEWERLVGDSFTAAFIAPSWYLAALDAFPIGRVSLITARIDNRLVGVLPLARIRTDARGLYFSRVTQPSRGDYQPLIVRADVATLALPVMLTSAVRHFGHYGVYWFPNIPSTDPSLDILLSFFSEHDMPYVEEKEIAPRLRFEGMNIATIEQEWPASHRKDVRRQLKRLTELGPVSLWQPATLTEAKPVLDEFFRVYDEKWLAQDFPGMFQDPAQRRYYHAILQRLWGRGVHFSTLRCGSQDVSYHFGFFSGGWLQWYRPSYRHEFGRYSPGKIHIAMLIEEGCRSGWKGFDFLLGADSYKNVWCNEKVEVTNIHAGFHSWAPSYLWFSRGKPFMRQKLQLTYLRAHARLQKRKSSNSRPE